MNVLAIKVQKRRDDQDGAERRTLNRLDFQAFMIVFREIYQNLSNLR